MRAPFHVQANPDPDAEDWLVWQGGWLVRTTSSIVEIVARGRGCDIPVEIEEAAYHQMVDDDPDLVRVPAGVGIV